MGGPYGAVWEYIDPGQSDLGPLWPGDLQEIKRPVRTSESKNGQARKRLILVAVNLIIDIDSELTQQHVRQFRGLSH